MSMDNAVVYIVDDDASVRKALTRLLQTIGFKAVSYASARELLNLGVLASPGCVVLDVQLPGLNGLDLQQELAARNIETPIIFITGHGDIPMSVKAMKGGAVDFLTKPFQEEDLLRAIQQAVQKDAVIQVLRTEKARIQSRIDTLTPREREVFGLVIKGLMNKEIADVLGASEKTVKVHRGRVMEKMQVDSVAELVHAAECVQFGRTA